MITLKKEYFNKLAEEWETHPVNEAKIMQALSMSSIKQGDFVLDIGCGTGVLIPFLKSMVSPGGAIIEMDFAKEMLRKAKIKYSFANIYFITADGEMLPIQSQRFNHIICFASFPHFEDKEQALQGFYRTLLPSGSLSIIHFMGSKALNLFHHQIGGPIGQDYLPPDDELRKLLSNAGFHDIYINDEPDIFFAKAIK